jgi:hypothetical protein
LTYGSDKLPAIAGAATMMPQAGSSRYLAGLWSDSFHLDLLWRVRPYDVLAGCHYTPLSYDDNDGGPPTWSWASMKWQVDWFVLSDKHPQPVATVVSVGTEITNELNAYGEVKGGRLTLKGRIKYCVVYWDHGNADYLVSYAKPDGSLSSKQTFMQDGLLSWTDRPLAPGQTEQKLVRRGRDGPYENKMQALGAVFCIVSGGWIVREYMGMVLGWSPRASAEGCYERVGVSTWLPAEWYDSGEEAEITIV